jgi:DNA-binding LytR/AlgR family response regulator
MNDARNAQDGPPVEPVWEQNRPAWDDTRAPGTNGRFRGMSGDWPFYAAVAAIALTIGIVNALSAAQDAAWRGRPYDLGTPLLWEMSSIFTIVLIAPLLLVAVRRMRTASGRIWPVGLAIGTIIAFSALHIAGMVAIRKAAMWLLGSTYDFHLSVATLMYEFRKDVVTCLLIGGALWLIDNRREAQPPQPSAPEPPGTAPHTVWLRDGTTRIRIQPSDIVWVSSAGNYVEYSLANGSNHLVRGTLAAAESQLARFNLARIHRTRLANLGRVTGVDMKPSGDFELTLDTGQTVQGSRRYRDAVASLDRSAPATLR